MRDLIVYIHQHMKNDENVVFLTGDLGFGVLTELFKDFPERVINCGVAEQNMTAVAAGLALLGKKVFTYSIGNFNTLRALEQIRNDVCYHDLDVNILSVGGGFSYGQLGASHFALEDVGILSCLPNLQVFTPGSKFGALESISCALREKRPTYIRIDKSMYEGSSYLKSQVINPDILILAMGGILSDAIDAANQLKNSHDIVVDVKEVYSLLNFDWSLLEKTNDSLKLIITLEEHVETGGLYEKVIRQLFEKKLNKQKILAFNSGNQFPKIVGSQKYLRAHFKIDTKSIVEKTLCALND